LQGLYKKAIYVLLNGFYHQSDRMLISAKHNSVAAGFSEVRSSLSHNLWDINYAARLWQVFKAMCYEASTEFTMVVAKWHVRRTSGAPKALAVALSFCCLLGLGCPKQAFAKITTAEKDALYSIMNREDLNWRKLNLQTAVKTINQMPDCQSAKAFGNSDS
jgi:hypothetical protein